jgi:hypothetical protein
MMFAVNRIPRAIAMNQASEKLPGSKKADMQIPISMAISKRIIFIAFIDIT